MRNTAHIFAACVLWAVVIWSGCGSRQAPERSFAEAEELRLRYEKDVSRQAIAKYRDAMAGWKQRGDTRDAATAGERLGGAYEQVGSLEESLASYLEALSLSSESHDQLLESEIRSDAGVAHARLGHFDDALSMCRAALALAQELRGTRETARALNCLGEVEYHRGNSQAALTFYQKAEPLWVGLSDRRGHAETALLLGWGYSDLNKLDSASQYLKLALSLWTELGDQRGQTLAHLALARLQYLPGEYQDALNRLTRLRDRFQAAGDGVWEAASLSNMAYVYEQMGEGRNALSYWEEASRLFQGAGLQMAALEMFIRIGTGYLATDVTTALGWFEKARILSEASGNQHMRSWALRYIGEAHLARGEHTEALRYLEQSLDLQRSIEDPRFHARTLADVGNAYALLGDRRQAVTYLKQALERSHASRDRVGEAMALFGLARTAAGMSDLKAARDYIESALRLAESLRSEVESRDLRASYFASVHQYHDLYVDVLMRLHKVHPAAGPAGAAFEASERARARSLLESLTDARVDVRKGVDPDLIRRERALQQAFDDWAERSRRQNNPLTSDARALASEYRDLEIRYNQVQAEIRSKSPRYAALAKPQPLSLRAVQTEVLDDDTLLLEYAVGEERSYLWAVSNKDQASVELPARAEIERAAQRVHERMTARITMTADQKHASSGVERADREYWQEAARLSAMLLGSVTKKIAGKRLLVVADGALQYVPFAALPVPGRRDETIPMIVEHEIVSLPSASALAVLRREASGRKSPEKTVAVLADPVFELDDPRLRAVLGGERPGKNVVPTESATQVNARLNRAVGGISGFVQDGRVKIPRLASTRQEADAIVSAVPDTTIFKAIDFNASRATAMSPELRKYRILHFATHGVFNNEEPGLSGIVLSMFDGRGRSQDGFLRLHDIYGLELPAELVVLSACDTALGKPVKGEGLVGIVRGFMYAGAQRVVASLWKVDDEATVELMSRFYLEMLKEKRSAAAALREAQLAMWQQNKWRAPFYWAAFVLQGEWK